MLYHRVVCALCVVCAALGADVSAARADEGAPVTARDDPAPSAPDPLEALRAAAPPASDPLEALRAAAPSCAPTVERCFGLELYVAHVAGAPVQSAAWVAAQIAHANRLFALIGVGFEVDDVRALEVDEAEIISRADRDALGRRRYRDGLLQVFIVRRLANVDDPGDIRGVHWRDRADRARRWVIVSSIAPAPVLAHELGHYFNLRHSAYEESIMNKLAPSSLPYAERTFHPDEQARMRRELRRMLRDAHLTPR